MTAEDRFQTALEDIKTKHGDKYRKFVLEYVDSLKKAESARRAGFSSKSARNQAWRMMTNEDVRTAIELGLESRAMAKNEILSHLDDIAHASMADFITIETIDYQEKIQVPSYVRASVFYEQIAQATEKLDDPRVTAKDRPAWEMVIELAEAELDKLPTNPLETVIVDGPKRAISHARLDLAKAEKLGKLHLIRKVAQTDKGLSFELYSKLDALKTLGNARGITIEKSVGDDQGDSSAFLDSFARGKAEYERRKAEKEQPN